MRARRTALTSTTAVAAITALLAGCSRPAPREVARSADTKLEPVASASGAATPRPDPHRSPWAAMRLLSSTDGARTVSDDRGAFRALPFADVRLFGWNGDARSVLGVRGDVIVRCLVDSHGEPCRPLFEMRNVWRLASAPGDARVLAVPGHGDEAWVVDTTTGAQRSTPAREGAWLDDHRLVFVPYPAKQMHVWDVTKESDALLGAPLYVGPGAPEMREIVPSPDAKWIAVVTRRSETHANGVVDSSYGLAIQDATTGEWKPRFESAGHQAGPDALSHGAPPLWSPDGARLVYVDEGTLTVLEAPRFTARALEAKAHIALGWLDSTRVAYLVIDHVDDSMVRRYGHGVVEQFSDVVVLDVDTGVETKLTEGGALQGATFTRVP